MNTNSASNIAKVENASCQQQVENNCPAGSSAAKSQLIDTNQYQPFQASYEVIKRLGKGAQAQVYQARRLLLPSSQPTEKSAAAGQELQQQQIMVQDDDFALKVFNEGSHLIDVGTMQREIAVHQQFEGHPNIVQLYDYSDKAATVQVPRCIPRDENDHFAKWRKGHETSHGQSVMVLEKCEHGDLFDFMQLHGQIRDGKLLKFLFIQVCQALNALHTQANLAHMDIKLENILVGSDGNLKLCDFGMVESVDSDLIKRQGTEMYMAPEIIDKRHGETYRGVPADIFALGVLLWILAFGTPPFAEASSRDRNYSILQRNPDAFWRLHPCIRRQTESVDEDLKLLLTSMLNREIGMGGGNNRPETIDQVLAHPFFSKEAELLDASTNEWADKPALFAQFREILESLKAASQPQSECNQKQAEDEKQQNED